jgi:hypothetical protein
MRGLLCGSILAAAGRMHLSMQRTKEELFSRLPSRATLAAIFLDPSPKVGAIFRLLGLAAGPAACVVIQRISRIRSTSRRARDWGHPPHRPCSGRLSSHRASSMFWTGVRSQRSPAGPPKRWGHLGARPRGTCHGGTSTPPRWEASIISRSAVRFSTSALHSLRPLLRRFVDA